MIYEFFTSRNNLSNVSTFVGQAGRLFYDGTNGLLKISDGITPGGANIQLPVATTTRLGGIKAGAGANVATDGTLTIDTTGLPLSIGNLSFVNTTISVATANQNLILATNGSGNVDLVGNVNFHTTASPNSDPLFSVDNFGNVIVNGKLNVNGETKFVGNVEHLGNLLINGTTTNNGASVFNGDLTIAGNARIVGNTNVTGNTTVNGNTLVTGYTTVTGTTTVIGNTYVTGTTTVIGNTYVTGQVTTITGNTYLQGNSFVTGTISITGNSVQTGLSTYIVSTLNATQGAVEITGNASGLYQTPVNSGVMLQVTGQPNLPGRIYNDGQNNYAVYVGRRYNGNITVPSQVLNNQDVARYGGTAYTSGGWFGNGIARISIVANEDQTLTNQGSRIEFSVTPNGSNSSSISNVVTLTSSLMSVNTNIAVGANSTITTPRVVINNGGLRIINGGIWANVSFASDSMVLAYHPSGAGTVPFTVNLSNYTAGATITVQIRLDNTSRDINYGVATGENSSTAATSYNGNGIGSTDISNSTIQLLYTCYDGTAANTYVAVTTI